MKSSPILVWVDTNEKGSGRDTSLALAANENKAFLLKGFADLPIDARFQKGPIIINGEFKAPSDLLASILALAKDGSSHSLYEQVLRMRELGNVCFVLCTGTKAEVQAAIKKAVYVRYRGKEAEYMIGTYSNLVKDFRRKAWLLGVPVWYFGQDPFFDGEDHWQDLLRYVQLLIEGGDLMAHMPKPAYNERQVAALCLLADKVGPAKGKALYSGLGVKYIGELSEACKYGQGDLTEIPGIGPKLASEVRKGLWGVA